MVRSAVATLSNTAFYCCGVRMLDAEQEFSLCGDHYAERFLEIFLKDLKGYTLHRFGLATDTPSRVLSGGHSTDTELNFARGDTARHQPP